MSLSNNNEGDDDAMENPELDDIGSYQQRKLSAIEQVRDIFTNYYSTPPVFLSYHNKSDFMDAQPTPKRELIDACRKVGFGWTTPPPSFDVEWELYMAYMRNMWRTSSNDENNQAVLPSKGLTGKSIVMALSGGGNLILGISDLDEWPIRDFGALDNRLIELRASAPRMLIMDSDIDNFSDDRRCHNHSRNRYDLELHPNVLEWNGQKRTSKYHDSKYPSQKSLATKNNRIRNFAITQPSQSTRNNYNNRNKVTFNNQNMHKPKRTKK